MTTANNNNQEFLFVPITVAVLLIVIAAAVVWVTQIRPTAQAAESAQLEAAAQAPAETQAEAPAQALAGDPAAGQELFAGTCAACHGPTAEGIPGLGKDLTTSQFVVDNTDEELIAFIKVGRGPADPLNTTGVAMPPKGGNPSLDDEDLQDIVSYMRSIQK